MERLTVVSARPDDLVRYLDLLEEVADWLETRGITQWPRGNFHGSRDYYAHSIAQHEVQLAFIGYRRSPARLDAHEPRRSAEPMSRLDCVTRNDFLRDYYTRAGFKERGEIEARFPPPVGALRLRRFERRVG